MTASKPRFADALRDADRALADAGIPEAVDARLRQRLAGEGGTVPRRWRAPVFAGGLAAIAVAALVLLGLDRDRDPDAGVRSAGLGFAIESASDDLRYAIGADGRVSIEAGACDLVDASAGLRLSTVGELVVARHPDGVRVVRGKVRFAVEPRESAAPPARILVSDGAIEVLGTEFTVSQRDDGGEVALHEGRIRYVASDGRTRELSPGDTLSWPLPADQSAPAIDSADHPREPEPPGDDLRPPDAPAADVPARLAPEPPTDVLAELARHRSRGHFARATDLLRAALDDDLPPTLRERLSYELGDILTHHRGDRDAACAHWNDHLEHYPQGRYQAEVESAQRRLACEGSSDHAHPQ